MWKRYLVPCVLVIIVAGAIAAVVYKRGKVDYQASCVFQVSLPVTSRGPASDVLTFQAQDAAIEVHRVGSGNVFTTPALTAGIDPATAAASSSVTQSGISSDFLVVAEGSDSGRAAILANALCDEYVSRVIQQRVQERDSVVGQLETNLADLEGSVQALIAKPVPRPAGTDSIIAARQKAIASAQTLLAIALSTPPDDVAVVTRSVGGGLNDTRDLTRNVLIAGVASLLACFLIVMVGEIIREPRSNQ